jgi:signal peptidase I
MNQEVRSWVDEIVTFALIALLIVVPIRWFIAEPFIVRGASMEPTFENGEYLIVDQISYRFSKPERGDVIIMRYPKDPSTFFIKRIIGLPNETVEFSGDAVTILRGTTAKPLTLDESFLDPSRVRKEYNTYALGPDEYFVMGDNRIASSDSRSWGALPAEDIVGRTFLRLFPPTRIALFPGKVMLPQ